jgi:hypothetical protein
MSLDDLSETPTIGIKTMIMNGGAEAINRKVAINVHCT